ncbi:MAG: hypothetical protein HC824_02365 [Synechococcales cyanobacterium RM1_1_8]|nr:hypothetical protein [Synechococcales cyanobacterium RM1_1_8]
MDSPFLYSQSVSHRGHLIIPFQYSRLMGQAIYSYGLLSELGHQGQFHQQINPAGLHSDAIAGILNIACEQLDQAQVQPDSGLDSFGHRYVYHNNLIIICESRNKFFYDHYPPLELRNVAAPRLFDSEYECLSWIKIGLDRRSGRRP